jgi:hypothetical protein
MLKLEVVIHDQLWPNVVITVTRQTYGGGPAIQQDKQQYDLAFGKAEVMVANALRPMVEELVKRHQRK